MRGAAASRRAGPGRAVDLETREPRAGQSAAPLTHRPQGRSPPRVRLAGPGPHFRLYPFRFRTRPPVPLLPCRSRAAASANHLCPASSCLRLLRGALCHVSALRYVTSCPSQSAMGIVVPRQRSGPQGRRGTRSSDGVRGGRERVGDPGARKPRCPAPHALPAPQFGPIPSAIPLSRPRQRSPKDVKIELLFPVPSVRSGGAQRGEGQCRPGEQNNGQRPGGSAGPSQHRSGVPPSPRAPLAAAPHRPGWRPAPNTGHERCAAPGGGFTKSPVGEESIKTGTKIRAERPGATRTRARTACRMRLRSRGGPRPSALPRLSGRWRNRSGAAGGRGPSSPGRIGRNAAAPRAAGSGTAGRDGAGAARAAGLRGTAGAVPPCPAPGRRRLREQSGCGRGWSPGRRWGLAVAEAEATRLRADDEGTRGAAGGPGAAPARAAAPGRAEKPRG